jgi:hypothetical protein
MLFLFPFTAAKKTRNRMAITPSRLFPNNTNTTYQGFTTGAPSGFGCPELDEPSSDEDALKNPAEEALAAVPGMADKRFTILQEPIFMLYHSLSII